MQTFDPSVLSGIEPVQAARLRDGDTLVLKLSERISEQSLARLRQQMQLWIERSGLQLNVMVLECGLDLAVLTDDEMRAVGWVREANHATA